MGFQRGGERREPSPDPNKWRPAGQASSSASNTLRSQAPRDENISRGDNVQRGTFQAGGSNAFSRGADNKSATKTNSDNKSFSNSTFSMNSERMAVASGVHPERSSGPSDGYTQNRERQAQGQGQAPRFTNTKKQD